MPKLFRPVVPRLREKRLPWFVLTCSLFLLGLSFTLPSVGECGSISGVVQRAGQVIAKHRIMLIRFGASGEVERIPGETNTEGQFLFNKLETGPAFEYVVGIRYDGQLYRSESVRLESEQHRTGIVVEVEQPSDRATTAEVEQPRLHIANHLLVVVSRDQHLEVREVMRILNNGSEPYTGTITPQDRGGFSLYLPIPQGYYNLTDIQGLAPEHVQRHASGLYYKAPLPAGEHRVSFTYALPLHGGVTTILAQRSLPTASFDVLVQDEHLVASSDLEFGGRVAIAPHRFFHFRGTNLAVRSRSWLQLTRRTEPTSLLRIGAYAFVMGIAFLGIIFPLFGALAGQKRQTVHTASMTPEHIQGLQTTRLNLLRTIAELDDQRATEMIAEDAYQHQRLKYKAKLSDLSEQLRQAQQAKDAIG